MSPAATAESASIRDRRFMNGASIGSAGLQPRSVWQARRPALLSVRCSGGWSEPAREPGVHFLIEMPAVFAVRDPVVRVWPHEKPARHLHALERAPVLERVVDRHAEVVF